MAKVLSTIYKSTLRAINELVKDVRDTTGDHDIRYWAWEARADEDKLPHVTLIGLEGYHFQENAGLWVLRFGVTISTYNDANLLNEAEILDVVHEHFGFQKKMPIRNPDTGEIENELYCSDFEVSPMGQSELRNYRTISVEFLRTAND